MITLDQALKAGFTEKEWETYTSGSYHFFPPPVCTDKWNDTAWMSYIFGPRKVRSND